MPGPGNTVGPPRRRLEILRAWLQWVNAVVSGETIPHLQFLSESDRRSGASWTVHLGISSVRTAWVRRRTQTVRSLRRIKRARRRPGLATLVEKEWNRSFIVRQLLICCSVMSYTVYHRRLKTWSMSWYVNQLTSIGCELLARPTIALPATSSRSGAVGYNRDQHLTSLHGIRHRRSAATQHAELQTVH